MKYYIYKQKREECLKKSKIYSRKKKAISKNDLFCFFIIIRLTHRLTDYSHQNCFGHLLERHLEADLCY